jgi:hypothetical protein
VYPDRRHQTIKENNQTGSTHPNLTKRNNQAILIRRNALSKIQYQSKEMRSPLSNAEARGNA